MGGVRIRGWRDKITSPRQSCEELRAELQRKCGLRRGDFGERKSDVESTAWSRFVQVPTPEEQLHGEYFRTPVKWKKVALKTDRWKTSRTWLRKQTGWHIMYHGTRAKRSIIRGIVRDGLKVGSQKTRANGAKFGRGVYGCYEPTMAASYALKGDKPLLIGGDTLYVVFQCRIRPEGYTTKTVNSSTGVRGRVCVVGKAADVRPCGIMFFRFDADGDKQRSREGPFKKGGRKKRDKPRIRKKQDKRRARKKQHKPRKTGKAKRSAKRRAGKAKR